MAKAPRGHDSQAEDRPGRRSHEGPHERSMASVAIVHRIDGDRVGAGTRAIAVDVADHLGLGRHRKQRDVEDARVGTERADLAHPATATLIGTATPTSVASVRVPRNETSGSVEAT